MSIWFQKDCEDFVKQLKGNMMAHLGIEIVELGDDYIKGKMPVDHRTLNLQGCCMGVHLLCWLSHWAVWVRIWWWIGTSIIVLGYQ